MEAFLTGLSVELVMKFLIVGGMVMYCGFGVVLFMEAKVMAETFDSRIGNLGKMAALLHLALAVGLVALAVVIL